MSTPTRSVRLPFFYAVALCLATSFLGAQLVNFPEPILTDGQPAPGIMEVLDNLDRPNLGPGGILAGTADLEGSASDDLLLVNGVIFAREGMAVAGAIGATFGNFDEFSTRHHVNASGSVAYVNNLAGVPTGTETTLFRNLDVVLREGQVAPGVPGRTISDLTQPCMLDNDSVAFLADLSGSSTDDMVIYIDQVVQVREGDAIVGTAFAGFHWETFTHLTSNGAGDLLFEATTDAPDFNTDGGLFLKPLGSPPMLLLQERVTAVPAPSGMETLEFIDFLELTNSGDWILRGEFANSATVGSANDDCVVASLGGNPPTTIAQEGQPIAEIPGATLGAIRSASVNESGDVLVTAVVVAPVGVNIQEALFFNGDLLLHDNLPIPAFPGAFLASFEPDDVVLGDTGEMVFEGTLVGGPGNDGWFRVQLPTVFPVENLACGATAQNALRATWGLPVGFSYDFIQVSIDGNPVLPSLPGDAVEFTTSPFASSVQVEIAVEGVIGGTSSPVRQCRAAIFLQTEDLLLVGDSNSDSVGAYRAFDGAFVGNFVHPSDELDTPVEATLGPDQRIYVSDQTRDAVLRFDRNGNYLDRVVDTSQGVSNLRGLGFDGGNLFVCSGEQTSLHEPGVVEFDLLGNELGVLVEQDPTLPFEPFDVRFLDDGTALVCNVDGSGEVRLVPPGGGASSSILAVAAPVQVTPLANGNFVAAASNAGDIVEFDLTGALLNTWSVGGPVRGVAELGNGDLLLTTLTSVSTLDRITGQVDVVQFAVSGRLVGRLPAGTGPSFERGDCNADGSINVADAVRLLAVLFPPQGCVPDTDGIPDGPPECPISLCLDACDTNDDGSVNITDVVYLLGVQFPPAGCIPDTDGVPDGIPECPVFAAPAGGCGSDPTVDTLDCLSFPACP